MKRVTIAVGVVSAALALAACGGGSGTSESTSAAATSAASEEASTAPSSAAASVAASEAVSPAGLTVGPNGEPATPCANITLTAEQVDAVKAGGYTAALLWHTSGDFTNAVNSGAKDAFTELGVEVVAEADAGFDVAKQKSNVETALAKEPSLILSLPFDPVASAAAFKPAVDKGVKLVFLSNTPQDFKQGTDYVTVVTDDLYNMGKGAADALAAAIGGEGKVGYIFHDAEYYVTNQRDQAFKSTIENDYPGIEIVAENGLADAAKAQEIAQAMITQNPDLAGVYVTWAQPAEGVLAALRAAGNTTTKISTLDLSEPMALDMAKNGNTVALTADKAYELGACMATAGALGLLDQPVDPFLIAPALTVTRDTLETGWQESLNRPLPDSVKAAL